MFSAHPTAMEAYSLGVTTAESGNVEVSRPTCVSYTNSMHVVGGFMCAVIAVNNLLTIVTLIKVKSKVGSKNRLYVINVACSDFLMAPGFGVELILSQMGYLCDDRLAPVDIDIQVKRVFLVAMFIFRILSFNVSLFTILFIGIDRMLAVSKPIWYKAKVSSFRIKVLLAINWVVAVTLAVSVMTYYAVYIPDDFVLKVYNFSTTLPPAIYNYLMLSQIYLVAMPGNVITYLITYIKIKQQFTRRSADTANNSDLERIRRFYRMMLITLCTLAILYLPFMIAFKMFGVGDPEKPPWVFTYIGQPVALILVSNSWINPILYASFNKDYRRAYLKTICCSPRNKVEDAQQMKSIPIQGTGVTGLD
ncbi:hypothetical protein CAPTEDRAFT_228931 [Capitella teleta]|uniref:G-protein coupled receptors family 1 profile domain-containing protein n=1 Tax=Capitella teleta TaxID=283909 RepID=R7U0G3_CAPTE|nr:hypothetical protein CAPTEDRAFT_228931 [Capitella teleta]|eukprot:ELT99698.1 hypothetical protein CAPTEDRAFT_228931 [Capitella teleta]